MSTPSSTPISTQQPPRSSPSDPPQLRPLYLSLLFACPLLIALPPRKLDLYTFSLAGLWVYSLEEAVLGDERRLRKQRTVGSTGVMGILGSADTASSTNMVKEVRESLQEPLTFGGKAATLSDTEERERGEEGKEGGVRQMAKELWMGNESADWKEKRLQEEREKLAEGEGYSGLIMDQVREVFGGFGDRKDGEEESSRNE